MNVNGSLFDIQNFILAEVFVHGKFVSGNDVLGSHDKVLRTVVFWADLQHEVPRRRLSPNPSLTLIFLEQEWFWSNLRRGSGTGLC
jgi:hypothetical protein